MPDTKPYSEWPEERKEKHRAYQRELARKRAAKARTGRPKGGIRKNKEGRPFLTDLKRVGLVPGVPAGRPAPSAPGARPMGAKTAEAAGFTQQEVDLTQIHDIEQSRMVMRMALAGQISLTGPQFNILKMLTESFRKDGATEQDAIHASMARDVSPMPIECPECGARLE